MAKSNDKFYGTGRRKKSIARVYLVPGTGKVTINKRDIDEYFGLETLKVIVRQPLVATETVDKYDVLVRWRLHRSGWCYQTWCIKSFITGRCRFQTYIKEGWILNKRPKNEGKKEVRLKSSKTCSTVLKEIISAIATGSAETKYYVKGMFLYSFGVIFFYGIY